MSGKKKKKFAWGLLPTCLRPSRKKFDFEMVDYDASQWDPPTIDPQDKRRIKYAWLVLHDGRLSSEDIGDVFCEIVKEQYGRIIHEFTTFKMLGEEDDNNANAGNDVDTEHGGDVNKRKVGHSKNRICGGILRGNKVDEVRGYNNANAGNDVDTGHGGDVNKRKVGHSKNRTCGGIFRGNKVDEVRGYNKCRRDGSRRDGSRHKSKHTLQMSCKSLDLSSGQNGSGDDKVEIENKESDRSRIVIENKECDVIQIDNKECDRVEIDNREFDRIQIENKECDRIQIENKECDRIQIENKECDSVQIEKKDCDMIQIDNKECDMIQIDNKEYDMIQIDNKECDRVQIDNKECDSVQIDNKECDMIQIDNKERDRVQIDNKECDRVQIENKGCDRVQIDNKECDRVQIDNKGCDRVQIENKECDRVQIKKKKCDRIQIENKECDTNGNFDSATEIGSPGDLDLGLSPVGSGMETNQVPSQVNAQESAETAEFREHSLRVFESFDRFVKLIDDETTFMELGFEMRNFHQNFPELQKGHYRIIFRCIESTLVQVMDSKIYRKRIRESMIKFMELVYYSTTFQMDNKVEESEYATVEEMALLQDRGLLN